jgi:hypothetical protein
MRKSEMTDNQIQERTMVVQLLAQAGWNESAENRNFDKGRWVNYEARMEYRSSEMDLAVEYRANDELISTRRLDLLIYGRAGEGIELMIYPDGSVEKLLRTIISFQDVISTNNYKQHVRNVLHLCPSTYVYREDVEDNHGVVKLVDDNIGG